MRKKVSPWSILGIVLCIFAVLYGGQLLRSQLVSKDKQGQAISESDVPEDVIKCLTDFLEALKVSTEDSAQHAYFPNEDIELAHKNSGITLISYSIKEARKISDNLYAFNLLQEDSFEPGEVYQIWKFVGKLNGAYTVIGNVNYIPEELREGLDIDEFTTEDDSTLPPDTIIFDLG